MTPPKPHPVSDSLRAIEAEQAEWKNSLKRGDKLPTKKASKLKK